MRGQKFFLGGEETMKSKKIVGLTGTEEMLSKNQPL